MAQKTRTYLLVEARLGRDLSQYVGEMRQAGRSWMSICHDLAKRTDVQLTAETIRMWFSTDQAVASVAS